MRFIASKLFGNKEFVTSQHQSLLESLSILNSYKSLGCFFHPLVAIAMSRQTHMTAVSPRRLLIYTSPCGFICCTCRSRFIMERSKKSLCGRARSTRPVARAKPLAVDTRGPVAQSSTRARTAALTAALHPSCRQRRWHGTAGPPAAAAAAAQITASRASEAIWGRKKTLRNDMEEITRVC